MKRKQASLIEDLTDAQEERRKRICDELGMEMLVKLDKAFTALAAAMIRRAQRHVEAQLKEQQ